LHRGVAALAAHLPRLVSKLPPSAERTLRSFYDLRMEQMSRTERAALCNSALEAGESAPTLCGDWTVKDLVVHLLVRERDPVAAPGIVIPPLSGLTRWSERRMADHDFATLVERVRGGPPIWSVMAVPAVDRTLNTLEYFVHHEDIRRAQPGWKPRELTDREQRIVFKAVSVAGKGFVKPAGVPVEIRWPTADRQRSAVLARGADPVVITGEPAELTMYLFGRDQYVGLSFDGPEERVASLQQRLFSP
jgi:uncharacterized protein (TIGR03085 family)